MFFLPNHKAARLGVVSRLLTRYIHTSRYSPYLDSRKKSSDHSTEYRGDRSAFPQETRRKFTGPFADIVTLTYLKDCQFLYDNNPSYACHFQHLKAEIFQTTLTPTHAIPGPEELVCMFFFFFNGLHLKRILTVLPSFPSSTVSWHNIEVVIKPLKTLQQELPFPKFRPSI